MSLSVSSFPERPAMLSHHQKRQKQPSSEGENKRAFFGTLFSKGSLPFLKRIRGFAKANVNVKGSVIHHRHHHPEKVPPSHSRQPSSVAASPIKASGIVIDLTAVPHNDEYFSSSKSDDADAFSIDVLREPWPSPPTTPAALPFPTVTNYVSAAPAPTPAPTTVPIEGPTSRHSLRNNAQPPEKIGEIASVVDNLKSHYPQASTLLAKPPAELSRRRSRAMTSPTSGTAPPCFVTVTAVSTTSHSPTAAAPTTMEGRARSRSVSTSVKRAAATEAAPVPALPSRPRHKSETSIGVRGPTTLSPHDIPQAERRGRGKSSPTPPLPSGIPLPKQPPQERGESRPKRPRQLSSSSSRSGSGVGNNNNVVPRNSERSSQQAPTKHQHQHQHQQTQNQPLLTAHMLCMRSGSRPLPTTTHTHLLSVSGRPPTAHAGARPSPSRAVTATSLLVPRLSPEQVAVADRLYASRPRPKTTDGASPASSRPRTPSTSLAVRSSEAPHNQLLPPPPTPQTPTLGLVDSAGRRSRLPVLNTQAMVPRAATAAAVGMVR